MAEKDQDLGKFAAFFPVETRERENGRFDTDFMGLASDPEIAEQAAAEIADELDAGSWSLERLDPETHKPVGKSSYFFSSATWKAPWQPKGPKPNWIEPEKPEPIN